MDSTARLDSATDSQFLDGTTGVDAGLDRAATVYANALLGAANHAGQTAQILDELDAVVDQVIQPFPRFEAVLCSWLVPYEETAKVLDRVFGGRVSPLTLNFLKVLSRHGRMASLRAVRSRARLLHDQMRGRVHVELATAQSIDRQLLDSLRQGLAKALGGEPVIREVVSPELIGGVMLRIGDTVYDGSVASQLDNLRQQIIDRSVHEIQSRRDRFRYPAGN